MPSYSGKLTLVPRGLLAIWITSTESMSRFLPLVVSTTSLPLPYMRCFAFKIESHLHTNCSCTLASVNAVVNSNSHGRRKAKHYFILPGTFFADSINYGKRQPGH